MEDQTFLFKVILIGNSGVGKTCLARRFIQGEFPVNKGATIGVDFMIKPMMVNGKFVFCFAVKLSSYKNISITFINE